MKGLHGGDVWEAARTLGLDPDRIVDFSASINPLGMPPKAKRAAKLALDLSVNYPEPCAATVTLAYAERHGLDRGEVLAGNGSVELIYLIPRVIAPRKALIVEPAFSEYRSALKLVGCRVDSFVLRERDGFMPDFSSLSKRIDRGYDVLYMANPANPTGALLRREDLLGLAASCGKRGTVLVVDEAFGDFAEEESVKHEVRRFRNLIVLRSMTKFFAMAGLRLGFLLAHGETVRRFRRWLPPWSVNTVAAAAGTAALLEDRRFLERSLREVARERGFLSRGLEETGLARVYPSSANFIMARVIDDTLTAAGLGEALKRKAILIRVLGDFRGLGPGYLRVAVRRRRENELLLEAIRKARPGVA